MMRIGMAAAATALLGGMAFGTPAQAALVEVCDPVLNGICVQVLTDAGEPCPGATHSVIGVPIPNTNRALVRICALP